MTHLLNRLDVPLRSIATANRAPAAVLAAVAGGEQAVACQGDATLNAHTLFELGSVTKTFTGLLLADMVSRGEVGYDDPITDYLPPEAVPRRTLQTPITLAQLATHTAGLHRVPANLYPRAVRAWWTNPYAGYHFDHLYRATARIRPSRPPGTRVHYSNFGVGLLGQLLANAVGRDYRDLVIDRVCRPLGMIDSRTVPAATCAPGHRRGRPVVPWEMDALAPAGTLRSSGADLVRYLAAQLHPDDTVLAEALRAAQQPRVKAKKRDSVCLVWNHRSSRHGDLLFHGGATRGFTSFIGFCPQAGIGVAALANNSPTVRHNLIPIAYAFLKELAATPVDQTGAGSP